MALFKISKGASERLPSTLTEGYAWYTYDDSKFYIDYKDDTGTLHRKAINAADAETVSGHTVQIDVPSDAKFTDTTYSVATTSENGLMSYSDKTKLDGMVTITNDEIDAICEAKIYAASEVSV